jgi:tRNA A22 N-methylase
VPEFAPDNIVIAGMGGEMIASILAASEYPKESKCRLVLQPQSMQDTLRRYLAENGFSITDETVVLDGGKFYQIIAARYTGEPYSLTDAEYKLGKLNLARAAKQGSDAFIISALGNDSLGNDAIEFLKDLEK